MSLTKEIRKVHNELYKTSNRNVDVLLPIALTFLDTYRSKQRLGVSDPVGETASELKRASIKVIDEALLQLQNEHPDMSPLLRETIQSHMAVIREQPESRISQMANYISKNRKFLDGLNQEDFIGILYETMVASEFDKQDGRFFTPKNVILINVEIIRSLLEENRADLSSLSVCDPCCGSGRFLIYWVASVRRFLKEHCHLSSEKQNEILMDVYAHQLFGIDIHRKVAGYACWNMIFHGDGATNIANADSLNHYGILVHWELIQKFIREFEEEFSETKRKIQQRELQDRLRFVESKKEAIMSFRDKEEIDISSSSVIDLIEAINTMLEVHSEVSIEWWSTIRELHNLKDFDSINEITKFQWNKIDEDIASGFDIVLTNPPFGRGKNLQISDPYILCQYKLATEAWIGDLTKKLLEELITRQFKTRVEDFYLECLKEVNIPDASRPGLSKKTIRKLANEYLFEGEGNRKNIGEHLFSRIARKLGKEWVAVEDILDFDHKLTLVDSMTGNKHTIYYDKKGKPIFFKKHLPKQVLFLEQFLRMVKNGGKVFTVIDTGVLSNNEDEYVRRFLLENSIIHAVVEFPHNAFKAAGTGIKTAVILYERRLTPPNDYEIFGSLPQNLGYVLNKQDTPPDPDHNDLGRTLCDYREYLGLGKLCEKPKEECDWAVKGYCSVWRSEIERVEEGQ